MRLNCPHCSHVIDYSSDRPRFCSFCGQSLSVATSSSDLEAPTLTSAPEPEGSTESRGDTAGGRGRQFHHGDLVGGYRLERKLGSGAMGSVFEAEHLASGQRVAVKLIAPEYAMSPAAVERFRLEGRLASTITHPRCVFVMAADEDAGQPYIVMELMPGSTLTTLISERGPMMPVDAIRTILDVIDGLHEAHRLGVIHRDVKPSNCFLDARGRVKVGDFGLAKSVEEEKDLTRSGTFVGTVMFASPEQIKRQSLDIQSDVYSVCATLYYLLTGKPPFGGADALAAATRIVTENAPSLRTHRPEIPVALDRVILKGLEREKSRRWTDLEALRRALLHFLPGQVSIGGVGSRFVAYVVDYLAMMVVMLPLEIHGSQIPNVGAGFKVGDLARTTAIYLLQRMLVWTLYYAIFEGIWGWSPGKLLMRMRVCRAGSVESPGIPRAALRALVCFNLLNIGTWSALGVMIIGREIATDSQSMALAISLAAAGLVQLFGFVLGMVLLTVTMRKRNGYSGLHEVLSGTRVLELPRPRSRRCFAKVSYHLQTTQSVDLPERIGRFHVEGALRWGPEGRAVVARDPSLGRSIWITLRNRPLTEGERRRRDVSRPGRLRWVASGNEAEFSWDAYLAPRGAPLPAVVASVGPLPWEDASQILEQLAVEMTAAVEDDTVPEGTTAEQIWIDESGRVQVLGKALSTNQAITEDLAGDNERSLRLLRVAATCMLEGKSRVDGPAMIRAPIPRYASHSVNGLFPGKKAFLEPREFRDELREYANRPAEITRQRRFGHLCVLGCLLVASLGCLFITGSAGPIFVDTFQHTFREQTAADLEELMERDLAVAAIQPDPSMRLVGAIRYMEDQERLTALKALAERDRLRHEMRMEGHSIFVRRIFQQQQESVAQQRVATKRSKVTNLRHQVDIELQNPVRTNPVLDGMQWFYLYLGPCIWIVWAFVARGGLSFRLMGIDLISNDGRRARRWRCLVRAVLFWFPLVAMWSASLYLEQAFWLGFEDVATRDANRWMLTASWVMWWFAIATLAVYFVLALRRPQRAPHDRIAGTWLMPR